MGGNGGALIDLFHDVRSIDNADGNFGFSIPRGNRDALTGILSLVVSWNLLFLQDGSGSQIQWGIEGNLDVAQWGDEGIVCHNHRIYRIIEISPEPNIKRVLVKLELYKTLDLGRSFSVKANDPYLRKPPLASSDHRMRLEGRDSVDRAIVTPIEQLFIANHHVFPQICRISNRLTHHEFLVGRSPNVGGNIPKSCSVVNSVENLLAALGHAFKFCVGICQIQKVRLGGLLGSRRNENVFSVKGLAESNPVQLVVFLIQELVGFAAANDSSVELKGTPLLVKL
mmetsp:Transcript_20754/g.42705  ORF Transcript_20754/g.42705 Transcript_20754/m.42705 type:complete len:283 (+) Transcript_20754:831-1679(+)